MSRPPSKSPHRVRGHDVESCSLDCSLHMNFARRISCYFGVRLRPTANLFNPYPRHPRIIACTAATLLLCTISATVLVSDAGVSFGSSIPVLSGVEPLKNVDESRSTAATVCICSQFDILGSMDVSDARTSKDWACFKPHKY